MQIAVHALVRAVPNLVECRVVVGRSLAICERKVRSLRSILITSNVPFDDKLPNAAALLPCTSMLEDLVSGISTLQIPMSNNCDLSSSVATCKPIFYK